MTILISLPASRACRGRNWASPGSSSGRLSSRLLPASLVGKRVLDFGCGFGYFAREMRARGAREVVGIDLAERILQAARARADDQGIVYRRADLAHFQPDIAGFDLVLSSLMLHYLADYPGAMRRIAACLFPGGRFAFSVEHPVYTAPGAAAWHTGRDGRTCIGCWTIIATRESGAPIGLSTAS